MKVTLNGRPLTVPQQCEKFQDLLSHVEDDLLPRGHVITLIVLDGAELDDDGELEALARRCADISTVGFVTARAVDLAREGLEQAVELLPALTEALRDSARLMREGHIASGLDLLYESLGHVEWYIGLIAALDIYFSQLAADSDEDILEGAPLAGNIPVPGGLPIRGTAGEHGMDDLRTFASVDNLRTRLIEAQRLQQAGDMPRLADLLEHEVLPIAKLWAREAPLLLRRVAREGAVA
ncbi:MAG: hypothetical protein M3R04_04170 [bacterium]|nr:hypothetical protein [bacterium]